MKLRPYQEKIIEDVRSLMRKGVRRILIVAPCGCVSGDTIIRMNRAAKGYSREIKKEYDLQNHPGKNHNIDSYFRGLDKDLSRVSLVKAGGVVYSGERFCIKLSSKTKSITLTPDHRIWTKEGWVEAQHMIGKEWAIDTPKAVKGDNPFRHKLRDRRVQGLKFHPYARMRYPNDEKPFKEIERHRAIYEAKINGLTLEDYLKIVRTDPVRAATLTYNDPSVYDIHHINGDHYDNSPENLIHLTKYEHKKIHSEYQKENFNQGKISWEEVLSIEEVGVIPTYDVVGSETESFTGNDIVIHNSGKTALTTSMLGTAASKGLHSWFVVHRSELLRQSVQAFKDNGINVGVIASGVYPDKRPLIQVASIHSLKNRFKKYPKPSLIYWDESQFNGAATWENLMKENPNAFHIGLTATPCRLDGKGLGKYFDEMVLGPTTRDLISGGYLCDYDIYMPSSINTDDLKIKMGDFDKSGVNELMSKPSIVGDVIREYKKIANNKRALVFAHSIEKSQEIVRAFNAAGISAVHLDGETPQFERERNMRLFERGEIKIVSNVNLFSEGLNIPNIEVVIMLRPTMSLGLYIQQVGRAMRKSEGKDRAIIIDHVGNTRTHGLPCEARDWSLDGNFKAKRAEKTEIKVKTCKVCYAVQEPTASLCKFCGTLFEKKIREVAEVEGELELLDVNTFRKKSQAKQEQGRSQTLQELIALGKKRGYKKAYAWARHIFQARQAKKLKGIR